MNVFIIYFLLVRYTEIGYEGMLVSMKTNKNNT